MSNETASAVLSVATAYADAGKSLPAHVVADLLDVVATDDIATRLRNEASRLLERSHV